MSEPDRQGQGPARGYSWPQAEPGNDLALKHGAYADVKLGPRVDELADQLRDLVPGYRPSDEVTVRLLGLTLARAEAAAAFLEDTAPGAHSQLEANLRGWVTRATALSDRLGLSPAARAKLGVDVAVARRVATLTSLAEEAERERLEQEQET